MHCARSGLSSSARSEGVAEHLKVTTRSCHCGHSSVGGEVTAAARAARRAPAARARPAARPGGSGDGASCRSSSAGDAASWRGAAARAGATRGLPSPSLQLLRVSSPVYAPLRVGFETIFLPVPIKE